MHGELLGQLSVAQNLDAIVASLDQTNLAKRRLVDGKNDGIKVLGNGKLSKKLTVQATRFSETARKQIEAAGGRACALRLDVTRGAEITAAVREAEAALGPLDILVNNAGITLDKPSVDVTDEEWHAVLSTNLTSMFRCCRAVAPGMIARGRGKIINVGSMYGKLGVSHYAAYCASKAAADGLTRSLAAEWARHGIRQLPGAWVHEHRHPARGHG